MRGILRALAPLAMSAALMSCTSLYHIHDPASGVISAGQLPDFLKSIRCEMITFYEIERSRKVAYDRLLKSDPIEAFRRYSYFNIATDLYGAFTLELKVTDTAGLGSGTTLDHKLPPDFSRNTIAHLGPTAGSQGTYDLIWAFLLKQNAKLAYGGSLPPDAPRELWEKACYSGPISDLDTLEALAENQMPERVRFTRMVVNLTKPLAAWLRDNGSLISAGQLLPGKDSEMAEAAQMYYSFALQASAGLEGKYSLTALHWSALAAQASGSMQQNSNLQIYINGPGAAYVNSAKAGAAGYGPKPDVLGSANKPMHVTIDNQPPGAGPGPKGGGSGRSSGRGGEQRFLIAPIPIFPPSASPQ
jgi:hypothetical protein